MPCLVIFTKWEGSLGLLLVRLVRQSDHWAAIQQTKQRCVPTGAERWPVQEHPETCEAGPWGFRRVAVVFKSPAIILVKKNIKAPSRTCGHHLWFELRCLLPGLKKNQVDEWLGWSNEAPSSHAATICNLSLSCTLHPTRQWSHFSWPSCRMFSSSVLVVPPRHWFRMVFFPWLFPMVSHQRPLDFGPGLCWWVAPLVSRRCSSWSRPVTTVTTSEICPRHWQGNSYLE